MNELQKRFIVFLVHGTWPRGWPIIRCILPQTKDWFDRSSEFAARLSKALSSHKLELKAFNWSGNNSILDRDRAAKQLAKELLNELQSEDAFLIIIGHSHGGNVALKAVEMLGRSDRHLLITMGTPFLRASLSRHLSLLVAVLVLIGGAVFRLALPHLPDVYRDPSNPWFALSSDTALFVALWFATLFSSYFIYMIVLDHTGIFFTSRRVNKLVDALSRSLVRSPVLVIRAIEDEISVAMMLTTAASKIISVLQSLYGLLNRFLYPPTKWRLFLRHMLIVIVAGLFSVTQHKLGLFVYCLAAGVVGLQLVRAALAATVFGTEMLVGCASLGIWSTDTPDARTLTLWSLPALGEAGLRHSMHQSEFVPRVIAIWIEDQLQTLNAAEATSSIDDVVA